MDLSVLSSEHEALRGAYNSLEGESQQSSLKLAGMRSNQREKAELEQRLTAALTELEDYHRKQTDIQSLENNKKDLEHRVTKSELARILLEGQLREAQCEIQSYRNLAEALKEKLKNCYGYNNDSNEANRQFLDTFEEVMRDEMTAMKLAFEEKLRISKEAIENLSKKHHQEIMRLRHIAPLAPSSSLDCK